MTSGRKLILGTAVVLGAVGLLLALGFLWVTGALSARPFDAEAWRSGPAPEREHMVDDLIEGHTLMGMPRAKVLEILGPPERDETGTELEWVMSSGSFYVRLDAEGRVTSVFERMW